MRSHFIFYKRFTHVSGLEELRSKREELGHVISREEEEKEKIQSEIKRLQVRLTRVEESLESRYVARSEYDKTIKESEAAFTKVNYPLYFYNVYAAFFYHKISFWDSFFPIYFFAKTPSLPNFHDNFLVSFPTKIKINRFWNQVRPCFKCWKRRRQIWTKRASVQDREILILLLNDRMCTNNDLIICNKNMRFLYDMS